MIRQKRALLVLSITVTMFVPTSGWLISKAASSNGVSFTAEALPRRQWAFKVGEGNPISMGLERQVDADGNVSFDRQVLIRYKRIFVGPFLITCQIKEYPA
jgi:hypothetical protein